MQSKDRKSIPTSTILEPPKAEPVHILEHQVTKPRESDTADSHSRHFKSLNKRRLAKIITNKKLGILCNLDSTLKKAYKRSFSCVRVVLQVGHNSTAETCKARWCFVCTRIRIAKLINAYYDPIKALFENNEVYHVVLSIPTVYDSELSNAWVEMRMSLRRIVRNLKKTYGLDITALRSSECTYNPKTKRYHPHYHLLIAGRKESEMVIQFWLKQFPKARIKGQSIGKADVDSIFELFKYTAKGVIKNEYNALAEDAIFRSLYRKKTVETFGSIKKSVAMGNSIRAKIDWKGDGIDVWVWDNDVLDWVNAEGELLMGIDLQKDEIDFISTFK
jgi:hypothetical protein